MKTITSKCMRPHQSRTNRGFTMVELLIVVAIIAILSLIGFMGARKLMDSASRAKSTSNVRQLISLTQQFAAENNGAIVHWANTQTTVDGVGARRNWTRHLLLTLAPELGANSDFEKTAGDAFARETGIFSDPKALKQAKGKGSPSGHYGWATYAYNNRIGVAKVDYPGQIEYANGAKNVNQVDTPNKLVLFSQRTMERGGFYFSFLQPEDGETGHIAFDLYGGSAPVGFFDGHVEWFSRNSYPSWGGISPRTGKPFTNKEMNELWFGRATPFPAP
jgi:prepilin-type N-terminal cleavage/methylation domain-containing protein/prepilin-type processing-associated H-X9-DG protein